MLANVVELDDTFEPLIVIECPDVIDPLLTVEVIVGCEACHPIEPSWFQFPVSFLK